MLNLFDPGELQYNTFFDLNLQLQHLCDLSSTASMHNKPTRTLNPTGDKCT